MALATTWPLTSDGAGAVVYTANQWRTNITALFTEGILGASSFAVTERAAGANMKLDIAAGVAVIEGDDAANQGHYLVREDAATLEAVTIGTADGSNPRHDLVGIQLNDPSEGGAAGRESVFAVVAGTAAATPSDPAVPDSFLVLARVVVPAGAASIEDADIEDLRPLADLAHEAQFGAASAVGSALMRRYPSGTVDVAAPVNPDNVANKSYVDGQVAGIAATGGTLDSGRVIYRKLGNMVTVWTTNAGATSAVASATLPAGYRPAASLRFPANNQTSDSVTDVRIDTDGSINPKSTGTTYPIIFNASFVAA